MLSPHGAQRLPFNEEMPTRQSVTTSKHVSCGRLVGGNANFAEFVL